MLHVPSLGAIRGRPHRRRSSVTSRHHRNGTIATGDVKYPARRSNRLIRLPKSTAPAAQIQRHLRPASVAPARAAKRNHSQSNGGFQRLLNMNLGTPSRNVHLQSDRRHFQSGVRPFGQPVRTARRRRPAARNTTHGTLRRQQLGQYQRFLHWKTGKGRSIRAPCVHN